MRHFVCLLAAATLLAGCATSTPEPRYYTLDMRPSNTVEAAFSLDVDRLDVAEHVERTQIAVRPQPTRIEYYALDKWAAGLDEQAAEKLETEFGTAEEGAKAVAVRGKITAFEIVEYGPEGAPAPGAVLIKLDLSFRSKPSGRYAPPLFEKEYRCRRPMEAPSPAAAAIAFSRGIEEIARQVAEDLKPLLD